MPFQKIQTERVADTVVRQIEQLILRGILRPGERLPSERDLSERLGVSRPSIREAIADLVERGLLTTRAGSGIFVDDVLGSAFSEPLIKLFSSHEEALFDYIAFRKDLEGLAAERAARVGSDTDLKVISTLFKKMENAHTKRNPAEEAALDAEFHMAIVEASHNVFMLHMMRSMFEMLRAGVFYNRQVMFKVRTTRTALLDQHRTIHNAIAARDPEQARKAIEDHLNFVESCMHQDRKSEANEQVAKMRYQHEKDRK
ncbi:MAG TPA: GntR family transcriptional regulator [Rhodobacteraceae bacterium]|jgi:GntR family transcriptional repressor for pyruvate dehydrogenase complex|nr:FCD domain-containing protein [Amylibacter sp.]MDG1234912.1 FCD domain-containing protein [Amylibacter sp.]MDG1998743.1 FCD domain-containing protein [Amylibacter sp.]HAD29092.1 GntR family transcriptional regulator [Paracoccaceae bacterium]|tara:strand:+ start:836 stop:1606 length:771 start_codon:yes stop_codon:yes gene_type:complete